MVKVGSLLELSSGGQRRDAAYPEGSAGWSANGLLQTCSNKEVTKMVLGARCRCAAEAR